MDAMEMFEDDQQLLDALEAAETDRFATAGNAYYNARQQQREWQRNLIEQQGGQINPDEHGRFEFDLRPMSHDVNRRYGIHERRYQVNLRQEGNLIDNIAPALRDGLQRAINQLLDQGNIPNTHRVYFDLFSERIRDGSYRANGLVAGDWRNNNTTVDRIFVYPNANEQPNVVLKLPKPLQLKTVTNLLTLPKKSWKLMISSQNLWQNPRKKRKNHRCMSGLIWKPVNTPVPMKLTSTSTKPMKAKNVCCTEIV